MNRVFQTKTGIFGEGAPKICVPIVEKSREGIWKKAEDIENHPVDIADAYYHLNREAASGGADLVDLETYLDETRTAEEIGKLRASGSGCLVMASNHDFQKTPSTEEMVRRLRRMEELGADAAKLAVMPTNRQDVLNLLQATVTAAEMLSVPVVTMSMGSMGVISRICGSLTGSAMTFASAGEASDPGKRPVEQMAEILKITG